MRSCLVEAREGGVLAGFAGCMFAVAPYMFFTDASDFELGEELELLAAFVLLLLGPFVIFGAAVGSVIAWNWPRLAGGGSADGPTPGLG